MHLTGSIGKVMSESASIAFQYVKAHAAQLNIPLEVLDYWQLHIHVPAGATPKDGPSAGITMATSIASVFTQRKIRKRLAMSGELTLRGKVLPVGGIKEKILAAKRAGIKEIILSKENVRHHRRNPRTLHQGTHVPFRRNRRRGVEHRLARRKVAHPLDLTPPKKGNHSHNESK